MKKVPIVCSNCGDEMSDDGWTHLSTRSRECSSVAVQKAMKRFHARSAEIKAEQSYTPPATPFPKCPFCHATVTVDWSVHEEECPDQNTAEEQVAIAAQPSPAGAAEAYTCPNCGTDYVRETPCGDYRCRNLDPIPIARPKAARVDETCPHCGILATGMNSNPDECLHNPANWNVRAARPWLSKNLATFNPELANTLGVSNESNIPQWMCRLLIAFGGCCESVANSKKVLLPYQECGCGEVYVGSHKCKSQVADNLSAIELQAIFDALDFTERRCGLVSDAHLSAKSKLYAMHKAWIGSLPTSPEAAQEIGVDLANEPDASVLSCPNCHCALDAEHIVAPIRQERDDELKRSETWKDEYHSLLSFAEELHAAIPDTEAAAYLDRMEHFSAGEKTEPDTYDKWQSAERELEASREEMKGLRSEVDTLKGIVKAAAAESFMVKNSLMEMRDSKALWPDKETWMSEKIAHWTSQKDV